MPTSSFGETSIPLEQLSSWHLDYAIAVAEKWPAIFPAPSMMGHQIFVAKDAKPNTAARLFSPTHDPADSGPILAREALNGLATAPPGASSALFSAQYPHSPACFGETGEIAALRAYAVKALSPKSTLIDKSNSSLPQAIPFELA